MLYDNDFLLNKKDSLNKRMVPLKMLIRRKVFMKVMKLNPLTMNICLFPPVSAEPHSLPPAPSSLWEALSPWTCTPSPHSWLLSARIHISLPASAARSGGWWPRSSQSGASQPRPWGACSPALCRWSGCWGMSPWPQIQKVKSPRAQCQF